MGNDQQKTCDHTAIDNLEWVIPNKFYLAKLYGHHKAMLNFIGKITCAHIFHHKQQSQQIAQKDNTNEF